MCVIEKHLQNNATEKAEEVGGKFDTKDPLLTMSQFHVGLAPHEVPTSRTLQFFCRFGTFFKSEMSKVQLLLHIIQVIMYNSFLFPTL